MSNSAESIPSCVLLVGSIPLTSTEEVFTTISNALPRKVQSIPDGETGDRYYYITWQQDRFPAEARRMIPMSCGKEYPEDHPGFTLESIKPTGYDDAAIESYQKFKELRDRGVIPSDVRFQVSLPIPTECILFFLREEFHDTLGAFYEQRMHEALGNILKHIPAKDLAIQWDIAMLAQAIEYSRGRRGTFPECIFNTPGGRPPKPDVMGCLSRACDIIPPEAHVGLHFCYGDVNHKHTLEPEDTGILADIAESAIKAVNRPIQWVHMPVPKERDDVEYFKPIENLDIGGAKLFLGLVHANDESGTKRRIAAAQAVGLRDFGVATECGMGRTPREELESILQISNDVTSAPLN